jgi:hypothetical protein
MILSVQIFFFILCLFLTSVVSNSVNSFSLPDQFLGNDLLTVPHPRDCRGGTNLETKNETGVVPYTFPPSNLEILFVETWVCLSESRTAYVCLGPSQFGPVIETIRTCESVSLDSGSMEDEPL